MTDNEMVGMAHQQLCGPTLFAVIWHEQVSGRLFPAAVPARISILTFPHHFQAAGDLKAREEIARFTAG